jgi:hypothetical protein
MNTITQNKSKNWIFILSLFVCTLLFSVFRLQPEVGSEIASSADEITVTTSKIRKR